MYNPWSIIHFLGKRKFAAYWANSSSNGLISKLIREGSIDINVYMNRVTLNTFSYFDTGKSPSGGEPERFYHGLGEAEF